MCWNLLNYPATGNESGDSTLRHPFYRTVIAHENPDILITEENNSYTGTVWFLNDVMNVHGAVYSKGTFYNGTDTNNEIYFRDSLFHFISNTRIYTDLRDINEFKIVHIATGDTLRIYAVHLKASSGSPNDQQRTEEVDSLRKFTNQLPAGTNFIVCGDFNIYGDFENAYQNLLQDNVNDDGNFVDPIVMTGTWHNYAYRAFHTQSTRTASFGGGATGGMNDRFDMILFSNAINQGSSGIEYVAGSTIAVGNDANHYNQAINVMPNTAAPVAVINSVYNASDHLPVTALFNFSTVNGIRSPDHGSSGLSVFPNPVNLRSRLKFKIDEPSRVKIRVFDILGKEVSVVLDENKAPGEYDILFTLPENLERGLYLIEFQSNTMVDFTNFIKY